MSSVTVSTLRRMSQFFIVLTSTFVIWSGTLLVDAEGLTAHATFYGGSDAMGTNNGACGYTNVLAMEYGTLTTALSAPLFNGGDSCGACYSVRCSQTNVGSCYPNSVVVTATNLCPHGSEGGWCDGKPHFDLSQPAFSQIAPTIAGVVEVEYEKVPCVRTGGIQFQLLGQTYFLQVLVHNVGGSGDITAVSVKGGSGDWIPMTRSWGQLWQTGKVLEGQSLSFSVTTGDGKTCVSSNVASSGWKYGQTFEGSQF